MKADSEERDEKHHAAKVKRIRAWQAQYRADNIGKTRAYQTKRFVFNPEKGVSRHRG